METEDSIVEKMSLLAIFFLPMLVFMLSSCNQLTAPVYQRKFHTGTTVTCEKCPPGTYVLKHCTKEKRTECGACPEFHYTEFWNYLERCRYCSVQCTEEQYEKVKCSPKQNRVCECKDGFYLTNGFCLRHKVCSPGDGVSQNGTANTNVECAPCPDGHFSTRFSSTEGCQKHSECLAGEMAIPGSRKHDTFCTACRNSSLDPTSTDQDRVVCDRAVMEYVALQVLPPRKLRRLLTAAKRMARESTERKSLLNIFISIQRSYSDQPFVNVMLQILEKASLFNLEDNVRKWFLNEN